MFTKHERVAIYILFAVILVASIMVSLLRSAQAHGWHHNEPAVVNNYETVEISEYRLSGGLSDSDLNEIISGGIAAGSHQFDWVTTRWQLSITGATQTSDWDEDSSFSFAIGKRFGKGSFMPNALFHVSYTRDIMDSDYVAGGATVPIGEP